MPKMFAFIPINPKWKSPWIRPSEQAVKLHAGDMIWREESWATVRSMGSPVATPHRLYRAGAWPVPNPQHRWSSKEHNLANLYDVRVVEPPCEGEVRTLMAQVETAEAEVVRLRQELNTYLTENFRSCRLVTKDDCIEIQPGSSRVEIQASLGGQKHPASGQIKSEKRLLRDLHGLG